MKNLKNKKTLVFILAVFMMAAFCLTACTKDTDKEVQNEPKEEVQNETDKEVQNKTTMFEKDESLDKFINNDLQNDVLEAPIGAAPPKLAFANDKYAGVLNYNGLLIYNIDDKKLSLAIDINGLGFEQIQGDEAIEITSNDEYLVLNKMGKTDGYVYSVIMTQNGYVVLALDYDNLKDSKLIELDKNYELVNSFNLSE